MSRRHPGARRTRRRSTSGQVVPIFALVAVVLFAATGLAIDAGMAYLTYNGAERAAAAAALAGVPYMPAGLSTSPNTSCTGAAAAAACAATARDGLTNGSTVNGHPVTVTVQRYPTGCSAVTTPCADNKLQVQVTAWVQPTFLHVLGFGDHQVTANDTAFFLPPISLGQPGAQLGSTESQLGTAGSYYFLRSEGYGNPRGEGDAFDPYNTGASFACQVGTETTATQGDSTDVHALSANLGTDVPNGTLTGPPYNLKALPTRGGYNFTVTVPSTTPAAHVQVYNPAFAPDGGFNPVVGNLYNLHEQDTSFTGNSYTDQYSAMEYTLFQVTDRFDHSSDTPLSQVIVDPLNVTIGGSPAAVTSFVDVNNGQTLSASSNAPAFNYVNSNIYHSWVDIGTPPAISTQWTSGGTNYNIFNVVKPLASGSLAPGSYRLRVDMLDNKGLRPVDDAGLGASPCSRAHKGYAVQLATSGTTTCVDPGCQISALDELSVYTPVTTAGSAGFSIPLFSLPADYAGQTVNFYIFDPGDVSGNNAISILNPDDASCGGTGQGGCLFTSSTGVPVYDLGVSRNTALAGNQVQAPLNNHGGTADSCTSPDIQPDGNNALVNTYPITGSGACASRSGTFFNGRWLLFQLQIPSNYAGGASTASSNTYWQLHYSLTSGTASDTFTIAVNYANSPVHLL